MNSVFFFCLISVSENSLEQGGWTHENNQSISENECFLLFGSVFCENKISRFRSKSSEDKLRDTCFDITLLIL